MAGNLKLELAQYREVEDFTKLGFVLDDSTKKLIDRGEKLTKLLIQNRFEPIDIVNQTIFLYAALNGFLDDINVNLISIFEKELNNFLINSIFYLPLKEKLKEELDVVLLDWILLEFKFYFLKIHGRSNRTGARI